MPGHPTLVDHHPQPHLIVITVTVPLEQGLTAHSPSCHLWALQAIGMASTQRISIPFLKMTNQVIDKSVFSVSKSSSQFLENTVAYKQLDMNMLQRLAWQSRILQKAMEQAQCGNIWPMSTLNDGCWSATKRVSRSLLLLCNGRLRLIVWPVVSIQKTQSPRVGQHDKNIQGRLLLMPWLNGLLWTTRYSYFALLHGCTHWH